MSRSTILATLALAVSPATAYFLMPCWPIMTERLDPIVNPGALSAHVHQIAGGDGFAPMMDYNTTQAASCTTCFVKGDHSNYWIPAMYYQYQNGSMERVPQVGSASMYYFNEPVRLGPGETMETFPEGLRMLAGDADKRTPGTDAASLAINYKCLNYAGVPTDSKTFPTGNCPDGVRAEVTYPSCWDGKNLDSADHKSHMAYPTGTFESGACPAGYPHHMVTLKVEFIFDTNQFKDMWYGNSQPFLWSSGDMTGYGLHADYVMGWDHALLESAVEQCFDINGVLANCPPFNGQLPAADAVYANPGTCTLNTTVSESVGGVLDYLPGCNAPGSTGDSKAANCQDEAKLMGNWAVGASSALPVISVASVSSKAPAAASSAAASISLYSEAFSPPVAVATSAAFYAESTPSSSSSSETPTLIPTPSPSPSISLWQDPSEPSGLTEYITVTDLFTETDWFTQTAVATETALAAVAGESAAPSWGAWRRQIGDHGHQHRNVHRERKGRRVAQV